MFISLPLDQQNYGTDFQIYDPNNKRYEVPIPTPKVTEIPDALAYGVNVIPNPFGIAVFRKSTGAVL